MVGSSECGRVVSISSVVWAGGSSRVLRKIFAAAVFMRSHSCSSATLCPPAEAETCTLPINSRVASAPICRDLPAGRRWKQSGCAPDTSERRRSGAVSGGFNKRSASASPAPRSTSRSSPVSSRLCESRPRASAWSSTAVAGVPASASGQGKTGTGATTMRARGPPQAISFCTAFQMSFSISASGRVPSTTWKRCGMLWASRR